MTDVSFPGATGGQSVLVNKTVNNVAARGKQNDRRRTDNRCQQANRRILCDCFSFELHSAKFTLTGKETKSATATPSLIEMTFLFGK